MQRWNHTSEAAPRGLRRARGQQLCLGEGVGERTVDGILLHKCHVRHQVLVEAYHLDPPILFDEYDKASQCAVWACGLC